MASDDIFRGGIYPPPPPSPSQAVSDNSTTNGVGEASAGEMMDTGGSGNGYPTMDAAHGQQPFAPPPHVQHSGLQDDGSASRARKRKEDGEEGEKKPKKTRQTQSCDACRARKVRCDRPPPGTTSSPDLPTKDVCSHCRQLGMTCTFEYKPKKRGPPNMYLKRMQALAAQSEEARSIHDGQSSTALGGSLGAHLAPSTLQAFEQQSLLDHESSGPGPGTLAHQNALQRSALHPQDANAAPQPRWIDAVDDWSHSISRFGARTQWGQAGGLGVGRLQASYAGIPGAPVASTPNSPNPFASKTVNPFEEVLSRPLLYHIIDLYFDYIYCLIPCIHKPTFMRDLHDRREERPGQDEWIALVFSLLEVTLVQMPRSFVAIPRREIKSLFHRISKLVNTFVNLEFTTLTVTRNVILYFHAIGARIMGNQYQNDMLWGQNLMLSLRLRLHEESSYQRLSPVEREIRKRIFWLQYGADKTIAAIDGATMCWNEVDCGDVTLPSAIDDEYITEDGYLDQPSGQTPILAGFYYISKLFRLLGQVIDKRRYDRVHPPSGLMLQLRINDVEQLFHDIVTLMDDCPDPLKLDMSGTPTTRLDALHDQWDTSMSADIRAMLLDPGKAHQSVVKDSYLVQQANIYVTQQMVRYIVIQYHEELSVLQNKEAAQQQSHDDAPSSSRSRGHLTHRSLQRAGFSEEEKDAVASDLLLILSKIRMEVIAVNNFALVAKVRFVASTLLDALSGPSTGTKPEARARQARMQGYLWDFLKILSDIEGLYALDDE